MVTQLSGTRPDRTFMMFNIGSDHILSSNIRYSGYVCTSQSPFSANTWCSETDREWDESGIRVIKLVVSGEIA